MWGTEDWGLVILGGFSALLGNCLYQLGGTVGFGKWLRRFVASFIIALGSNLIAIFNSTWTWQFILIWPCLIGGFSIGYGANTMPKKILRRILYATGVLMACFCGLWATGFTTSGWVMFSLACITGSASVILGVRNPFTSARVEEFLVCQVLTLYIPFWGFVG
ncbi:MAG TPA: hypothetical protein ENN27_03890 [Candidatus Atribacteria bacterium]|nr:hypothetical protein [Candidatus Atribacteria bacterium]